MASPEIKKLNKFLKAAQARHIPRMYSHCQLTWKKNNTKNKLAFYQNIKVSNFEIKSVEKVKNGEAIKVRVEFDYQVLINPGRKWIGANGKPIDDLRAFSNFLKTMNPGDKISITFIRDGKEQTVEAVLEER